MTNKAVILLSGGLDSLVALGYSKLLNKYNVKLALTFDYGQKAVEEEIKASKKICDYYKINHIVIKLDWLRDITKTSLVASDCVPIEDFETTKSAEAVWVPNRNALFINIAASFVILMAINIFYMVQIKKRPELFLIILKNLGLKFRNYLKPQHLYNLRLLPP